MSARARYAVGLPALLLACLALTGCAEPARDPDTLVVYAAGPRPLAESIARAFSEQTGARVELFAATTGQIMARLEAERYRPRADVVLFASRIAAEALHDDGRLLRHPDPEWRSATHAEWHDPDDHYFSTSAALVGIAFRADAHDPGADWDSVLSGRTGARVTMPSPSRSGAAGDFVVAYTLHQGEVSWTKYRDARRAGLEFAAANNQAIGGLLTGAFDIMPGAVDYLIHRQVEQGAPLVMHYPASGSALVERPIAILAHTPVPELARRYVDFHFTTEAQRKIADAHLLPARRDVEQSPQRRNAAAAMPPLLTVDYAEALREQTRILRRFQLEIERAEVVRDSR